MTPPNLFQDASDYVEFKKEEAIFLEGDAGDRAYVVIEGQVDIMTGHAPLDTILPGGVFGELALIDQAPRSATAIAKTDCKLVPITQERFTGLIRETPSFAVDVMKVMADRIRRMNARM